MLRLVKAIQVVLILALLSMTLVVGIFVGGSAQGWWKVDVVLTGSMAPTMPAGSLVLAQERPTAELQVGDVLMFTAPTDARPKIMHRIVSLERTKDARLAVRTQGDANASRDFWTAIIDQPQSLVVNHHVPYLGFLVHRPLYIAMILGGLITLLFSLGMFQDVLETARSRTSAPNQSDEGVSQDPIRSIV